ncbi:DUF1919 domain-containing protein [Sulfurimonas aquatica]|uniref:DUF1919 domain-containing protein n=1 Tax=Sulfurimonas aquatica TaxID=2672570 RepID=UPI001A99AFEB|nr:DUF1919 domain-containing protein [Sulfurimonas aquatica]
MKIKFARNIEKYIKSKINRLFINKDDFTIISNNCWGTFIYKKYAIPYQSPFVNLVVFAPDYIELLENFSLEVLHKLSFIEHKDSKHKDELINIGIYETNYPIGILDNKYELHFIHYESKEDAENKWRKRIERINLNKLIFKFSDGDKFESSMAARFDKLKFRNKVCFTSEEYKGLNSVITLKKFKNKGRVRDEWKNSRKEFNPTVFINNIIVNDDL